jgi:ABC-type phosphate transport system permease subunit
MGLDPMKSFYHIALMIVGFGVVVTGLVLMFRHQSQQAMFQDHLLATFKTDYHWRSIGDTYAGIAALAIGAVMMSIGAIVAR